MIYFYKRIDARGKVQTHVTRDINRARVHDAAPVSLLRMIADGFCIGAGFATLAFIVFGQRFIVAAVNHIDDVTGWILAGSISTICIISMWLANKGE